MPALVAGIFTVLGAVASICQNGNVAVQRESSRSHFFFECVLLAGCRPKRFGLLSVSRVIASAFACHLANALAFESELPRFPLASKAASE
jgi:hypothetical protein